MIIIIIMMEHNDDGVRIEWSIMMIRHDDNIGDEW